MKNLEKLIRTNLVEYLRGASSLSELRSWLAPILWGLDDTASIEAVSSRPQRIGASHDRSSEREDAPLRYSTRFVRISFSRFFMAKAIHRTVADTEIRQLFNDEGYLERVQSGELTGL